MPAFAPADNPELIAATGVAEVVEAGWAVFALEDVEDALSKLEAESEEVEVAGEVDGIEVVEEIEGLAALDGLKVMVVLAVVGGA